VPILLLALLIAGLTVVYVNGTNLNEKQVREGYAEVMDIPPSEFDSREWEG
jgi:micrococcal nuclease